MSARSENETDDDSATVAEPVAVEVGCVNNVCLISSLVALLPGLVYVALIIRLQHWFEYLETVTTQASSTLLNAITTYLLLYCIPIRVSHKL